MSTRRTSEGKRLDSEWSDKFVSLGQGTLHSTGSVDIGVSFICWLWLRTWSTIINYTSNTSRTVAVTSVVLAAYNRPQLDGAASTQPGSTTDTEFVTSKLIFM